MIKPPEIDEHILTLIRLAVEEDLGRGGPGDVTCAISIPEKLAAAATIVGRKPGVIAGTFLLPAILRQYSPAITCEIVTVDGSRVGPGTPIARLRGPARALLSAERVVLNFLGHMSGVATMTARYVDAVAEIARANAGRPVICDIRKTTPGFRVLDKYAVRCGGGVNHRMGLYDGVMLKDNHLAALRAGSRETLAALTARVRATVSKDIPLWLEVDTLAQLEEALGGNAPGADIILLDNFVPAQMRDAVALRDRMQATRAGKNLLEASGGITLENVADVARTGVDRISIGALTHSAPALDVAMEVETSD